MTTSERERPVILYVDDEMGNRIVFEQSFGQRFRVRTAGSGEEALNILGSTSVGVLITDQRMPGMTGHQLLVRAKALHPTVVRVVITAYSDLDPILAAVNQGLVSRYLIKPWDRPDLEELLRWALATYELGEKDAAMQLRVMATERLATIGSIAAAVAHDLNQPLNSLNLNAHALFELSQRIRTLSPGQERRRRDTALADEERALFELLVGDLPDLAADMTTAVEVMRGMTTNLQRFIRQEKSVAGECDPNEVLRYAFSVCQQVAHHSGATLERVGEAVLPHVRMPMAELSQVVINLMANAAQAVGRNQPRGGRVTVRAVELPDAVELTVEDNGPGMPPEVLRKVGTPFFSTRPEGTGLGVANCRRLVGAVGGTFEIESEPGRGTRIHCRIPRASAAVRTSS